MGCLCPSMVSHSSDGTHDPSTRSIYSEPSAHGEKSLKGVSSYWDITHHGPMGGRQDSDVEAKSTTTRGSGVKVNDIVKVGPFGRGTVEKVSRATDGIVTVSLTDWTLATGKSPTMYVLNPQLTMRRIVSRTGRDMNLEDVVVAMAP